MGIIRFSETWKKYKYALLIVAIGALLMLLPSRQKTADKQAESVCRNEEVFSLAETEEKMESILGQIDGVGRLRVMLTLASGPQLQLASDTDRSTGSSGEATVMLNRGSGSQEVIVTQQVYPVYQGAVIVCQGAGNSAVRLAITEAVSALTGLSANRISIVKWKES